MLFHSRKLLPPEAARCQVTEHCYHPSLNAQHPYKDYSFLLAAPDISRIYISGGTIHLWTVQVTNAEYIALHATFGRQRSHPLDTLRVPADTSRAAVAEISGSYNYNRARCLPRSHVYVKLAARASDSVRRQTDIEL